MKNILAATLFVMSCLVAGCSMPTTTVRTVDTRPSLAFKSAPENAVVYIDGIKIGLASEYDAESKVLIIEPGTHSVRVVADSDIIFDQQVFVESARKTITLR